MVTHASIMIVDDEPFARQAISEWLRRDNFRVIEADNGHQAIERFRKEVPDLVICDRVMPGLDGLQVLKETRSVDADIPFLMISGYASPSAAVKAMKQGAADFLPKPLQPEVLVQRVNNTLLHKFSSSAIETTRGMVLGAVLSTILWLFIIGAISAILP